MDDARQRPADSPDAADRTPRPHPRDEQYRVTIDYLPRRMGVSRWRISVLTPIGSRVRSRTRWGTRERAETYAERLLLEEQFRRDRLASWHVEITVQDALDASVRRLGTAERL